MMKVVRRCFFDLFQRFTTTSHICINRLFFSFSASEFELDESDDRRRSTRMTTAPKTYAKDDESLDDDDDDDDDDETRRPPPKRMRGRKRLGSDDSFLGDDDYERLARRREMVEYQKNVAPRATITDRIKQLVDEEKDKISTEKSEETPEEKPEPISKAADAQASDDDDFPDEQEIFKAKSLINLKNTFNGPVREKNEKILDSFVVFQSSIPFRPALLGSTHSYQHAIVDPTARFAMIRPAAGAPSTATVTTNRTPMNNVCPSNGSPN